MVTLRICVITLLVVMEHKLRSVDTITENIRIFELYVLLTVHPGMIPVNNQLDAQFFLVCLFLFSTCFGQPCAHPQENYCMSATPGLCHSERNVQSKCLNCNQSTIKKQICLLIS